MSKESIIAYLDEYNPWSFSDKFIEVTNRSNLHLLNKVLVAGHFFFKEIQKNTRKEYRAKQALIHILDLFIRTEDENILSKAEYIRNKTAQNILKELQKIEDLPGKIYNAHFDITHFKNWYLLSDIAIDDIARILYPYDASLHYKTVQLRDYLDYSILYTQQDKENLEHCLWGLENGYNVIHLSNHPTYFTFWLSIGELEQLNKKSNHPIEELNSLLYIILWWALMTNKSWKLALWSANILKTHPQTSNWKIPSIEQEQNSGIQKFLRQVLSLNKAKEEKGKMFFLAPNGTKDVIQRENSSENKIYFWDDTTISVEKSLNLVKKMLKTNNKTIVLLSWVNESALKNPNYVNPYNHEREQHCQVPIKTKLFNSDNLEEFMRLIDNKQVMSEIANMTINTQGKSIGNAVSSIELNKIKEVIGITKQFHPSK